MTRSSTNSQPTAILPLMDSSRPRSPSAFRSTTVLAQERLKPKTSAEPKLQPQSMDTPTPSRVATAICRIAPGRAMRLTCIRSFKEKCIPTPNIRNMTPNSASWLASWMSPTTPGVLGLIRIPAIRYPIKGGRRKRAAI